MTMTMMATEGNSNHVLAELWGLKKGLTDAKSLDLRQLKVEIDSRKVIEILQENEADDPRIRSMIKECKNLLKELEVKEIIHILRERNISVAKMVLGEEEGEKEFNEPPESILSY
ncbi:uncharacterized protein LOC120139209 [Hibiscus syriacus]|uniref:uncharacterized protein LOC120139209 n=1 Tax=Hibiscus syriacus TaxID=106335 RepID=UPI001924CD75|nr:uncharacterized protein LOC120139209 [Hibiscus syriacus]